MHPSPPGSICDPSRLFSRINCRGSCLPPGSEPLSSIPSSLASKLRVSYWGGKCLKRENIEEMLKQAEVEGFLQPGYKLGVWTILYQDLPCLQEPGARLVCPALGKVPFPVTALGADGGLCLSQLVQTGKSWKARPELRGA